MLSAAFSLRRLLGEMLAENGMPMDELPTFRLLGLDYFTPAGALRLAEVFRRLAQLIDAYPEDSARHWLDKAFAASPLQWESDGLLAPIEPHMDGIIAYLTPRATPLASRDRTGAGETFAHNHSRPEVRAGLWAVTSVCVCAPFAARC